MRFYTALITLILVALSSFSDARLPLYASNPIKNCPALPNHTPKNVNDLAPQDFGVAMALGDSISAAFAAKGRNGVASFDEYRGLSFTLGGDQNAVSLFSTLQKYSPGIVGASTGKHLVELPGKAYHKNDVLNAAQSDAQSSDLLYQVQHLITVYNALGVKGNPWKLLTLFVGANDLCKNCKTTPAQVAANFGRNLNATLLQLELNFPKTLVAVIPIFNLSGIYTQLKKNPYCKIVHLLPWECTCILNSNDQTRQNQDVAAVLLRKTAQAIVQAFQKKGNPLFSATYLPFTETVALASLPDEAISNMDCFHPSIIGQQQLAIGAWNSLLTPVAQRTDQWKLGQNIKCPKSSDRFYTS